MKKLLSVMALGLFALVFVNCGGVDKKDPKAVAQAYFDAVKACDVKAAMDLTFFKDDTIKQKAEEAVKKAETEEGKKAIEKQKEDMKDVTFTVGDVKEEGEKATVKYTYKKGEATQEFTMTLKKVNDEWLVEDDGSAS